MAARHAATDGSFGRSAGGAALRGAGLLAVAVILGIVLLRNGGGDPYSRALRTVASSTPEITVRPPTATTITVPVRTPGDVKVLPANGTTISGAGLATFNRLKQAGYNVLAASNTTTPATTSNVYFNPGFDREARVVAQLLGLPDSAVQPMPTPPPVGDTRGSDVIVVVGPDLARQGNPTPATSPATTIRRVTPTTAHAVTPTTAHTATTKATTTPTTVKH
jgi:hypothetical protein